MWGVVDDDADGPELPEQSRPQGDPSASFGDHPGGSHRKGPAEDEDDDEEELDPHVDLSQSTRISIDPELQGTFAPRLQALVERPWPVHRARAARLVLMALAVIAPVTATVLTWWGLASQADREVIDHSETADQMRLRVDATALTFDPDVGELAMRLVLSPEGEIVQGDRLTRPVTVVLNDLAGRDIRTYEVGSVIEPFTAMVPAKGSSARYPFDNYESTLRIGASYGPPEASEPLPLDLSLTAALDEFATAADLESTDNAASVDLDMSRRWASITWVVFFMFISWAIALGCAGIVWWVLIFHAQNPFWAYAMFASVLFALPSLRNGLPGSPRYGVLVDWAAFYWAIAIVAISLILSLAVWNITARDTLRQAESASSSGRSERTED